VLLAFGALGSAIAQVYSHVTAFLVGNLIAAVLSIPLVVVIGVLALAARSFSIIPLGIAFLIGVLPNPCTGGIHFIAHELAGRQFVTWQDYLEGLRRYGRPALVLWLVSVGVSVIMLANIVFYVFALGPASQFPRPLALSLLLLWLLAFAVWVSAHLYVFPLLLSQEVKKLTLVYRNALLMVVARPVVAIVLVPIWLALLILSSATGLATFIGLGLGAAIQHNAAERLLPTFRQRSAA
jgi:hypothetical protein